MTTAPAPRPPAASTPIVTLRISARGLYDAWDHCRNLADYIARFAASDRFDPEQLTTRLSTYLNEVLEFVFRARPAGGDLVLDVARTDAHLVVALALPTDPALAERLRRDLARVTRPDARDAYAADFHTMLASPPVDAGLLELVALHGVGLDLRDGDAVTTLVLSLPHE